MKLKITSDKKGENNIEFNGDTIIPWYISCLYIKHTPEGFEIRALEDFEIRKSYTGEVERLWVIGKDKYPVTQQIEDGVAKEYIQYEKIM